MNAKDYLLSKIADKSDPPKPLRLSDGTEIKAEQVYRTRSLQASRSGGVEKPSVLWRFEDDDHETTIDGVSDPILQYFNIECRAGTAEGAGNIAEAILLAIDERLVEKLADYDEEDNRDQQRGDYYAHILEVGLSE